VRERFADGDLAALTLRWLHGFAYHIDLPIWLFPLTSVVALAMAGAAVASHALRLAKASPVTALRYE